MSFGTNRETDKRQQQTLPYATKRRDFLFFSKVEELSSLYPGNSVISLLPDNPRSRKPNQGHERAPPSSMTRSHTKLKKLILCV